MYIMIRSTRRYIKTRDVSLLSTIIELHYAGVLYQLTMPDKEC